MPTEEEIQAILATEEQMTTAWISYLNMLPTVMATNGLATTFEEALQEAKGPEGTYNKAGGVGRPYKFLNERLFFSRSGSGRRMTEEKIPNNASPIERKAMMDIVSIEGQHPTEANFTNVLGQNEAAFFFHDIGHQYSDLTLMFSDILFALFPDEIDTNHKDLSSIEGLCRAVLEDPVTRFAGTLYMREQLGFLIAMSHDIEPTRRPIDLERMMSAASHNIAARGNIYSRSFGIEDGKTGEILVPGKHRVVVAADPINVIANPGAMYALIHNYVKNCGKKLIGEVNAKRHPNGARLYVAAEDISEDHYMITVADSGDPVSLTGFINEVRRRMQGKDESEQVTYLQRTIPRTMRIFDQWSQGEIFALYDLSYGEITELVHAGGITGIGQKYASGSGTGLLAVRYIAKAHNGKVLYTQSYKTGGPIFGVLLPKDPARSSPKDIEQVFEVAKRKSDYVVERLAA